MTAVNLCHNKTLRLLTDGDVSANTWLTCINCSRMVDVAEYLISLVHQMLIALISTTRHLMIKITH